MPEANLSHTPSARHFSTWSNQFTLEFEELALRTSPHFGRRLHAGLIDGRAIIEYDSPTEWQVSAVILPGHFPKAGAAGKTYPVLVRIDSDAAEDQAFMLLINNAIVEQYTRHITDRIELERAFDREARDAA